MAQGLRALASSAEDLSLIPRIHKDGLKPSVISVPEDLMPSSSLQKHKAHM